MKLRPLQLIVVAAVLAVMVDSIAALGIWTVQPSFPQLRSHFGIAAVNGVIYAMGGLVSFRPDAYATRVTAYDPVTGASIGRAVANARINHATVAVGGDIYVIGGEGPGTAAGSVEVYRPATDTWQTRASMPTPRIFVGAASVDDVIYVPGGKPVFVNPNNATNVNEAYDAVTNTWTVKAPMPTARYLPAVAALGGLVYVIGGFNGGVVATVEVYDPGADRWTTRAPLPIPRMGAGVVALNGRLYVTGGYIGGFGSSERVVVYDPATDTWTAEASMNVHRSLHGTAAVGGRIFVAGGHQVSDRGTGYAILNSVEAFDPGPPDPPTGLAFTITGTTLTLTWRAPTVGAIPESYIVEAGSRPGVADLAAVDTRSTATSLTVPNVPTGIYFIRVRARSAAATSTASNEIVVTVGQPGGCPVPTTLTGAVAGSALTLQWTVVAGAIGYVLEAGTAPGRADLGSYDFPGTMTSVTATVPNGTYFIRVRVRAACGTSVASNEVMVTIASLPGTYTGPFSGQVTITVSSSGEPNPTPVVCTFTYALVGTITVMLQPRPDAIGMAEVRGTRTEIGRTGSSSCGAFGPGGDVLNFRDGPVTGTTGNLTFGTQSVDTSISWRIATTSFAFSGSLNGGILSGTASYTHQGGGTNPVGPTTVTESGSATFPVMLR